MNRNSSGWTPPEEIDRLTESVAIDEVISRYGYSVSGGEMRKNIRMECPIENCKSREKRSYGQLSIERTPPYRIHCFSCGVRGKVFDLMWILKHRKAPTGGKVRGDEFREMLGELQLIANGQQDAAKGSPSNTGSKKSDAVAKARPLNVPLARSTNERTRALVDLWKLGATDPASMSPAASKYFRDRSFLTPDLCEKWGVSYLARNTKSTLRGRVVYRIDSVKGEPLAYAGRDPDYDRKRRDWQRNGKRKEPVKTVFPSASYFKKGLEFYGQQATRLKEQRYMEAIQRTGIWVVEGFNDVLNLDSLGQPAIGAMFNRLTDPQIEKLIRFVRQACAPGVTFLFDRDDAGQEGQKEAMAALAKSVPVLDGWGQIEAGTKEPEQIDRSALNVLQQNAAERWANTSAAREKSSSPFS